MNEEVQAIEVPTEPVPPRLGELLIAARERMNLTAADLARQLRLALRQIQALEENRFEALPGNTFVRGFIRNYARVVQADPAALLDAYERCRPQLRQPEIETNAEHIAFPSKSAPKWLWYLGILLLLLLASPVLVYLALHDDGFSSKPVKSALPPASSPTQAVPGAPVALPPPPAVLQNSMPDMASGTQVNVAPALAAQPVPVPPSAPVLPVASESGLQFFFDGNAWVEVRDKSGRIVFSQLSRRGDTQAVHGKPPFSVVVGNAAQVRITYNKQPFDLAPHIKVNVARFKLE